MRSIARSITARLLAAYFLAYAAWYLLTTLCAIVNFAWRQPMFDQWRMYYTFLSLPFPQNVLQLENGHRPILPNLIRVAEIHWFAADQLLQISIGTLCALTTMGLIAAAVWRERTLPVLGRSAGVMLAVLGVFWLGDARTLLHGNESLHAYLLTLMLVCAALATRRAHLEGSLRWFGVACAACGVATFCFGPGIASFPAIMVLGALLRLPWRWQFLPLCTLAGCLILYLFVLPGNHGVRSMLDLHPLDSVRVAAQWLSAPWVEGWLGLAEPRAPWVAIDHRHWLGHALAATANSTVALSRMDWRMLSMVIGLLGAFAFAVRALQIGSRGRPARLDALAVTIGTFVLASAAEIGIGRLDYMGAHPDQVYASRYLLWSCLFWLSLSLLLLARIGHHGSRWPRYGGLLFLVLLPPVLSATQRSQAVWGAIVNREAQRNAAALRSGVFDEAHFPGNSETSQDRRRDAQTVGMLRAGHLAMFADPAWRHVGLPWSGRLSGNDDYAVAVGSPDPFNDPLDHMAAARFSGWVTAGAAAIHHDGQLTVLADDGTVAGLAEFSFIAPDASALRVNLPLKRGFDGYIRNFDSRRTYRLAVIDFNHGHGTVLATLSPPPGPRR